MDTEEKQIAFDGEKAEVDPHQAMQNDQPMMPPDQFVAREEDR